MPANRTSIIRGGAQITYAAQKFYTRGTISIERVTETFPLTVDGFGEIDQRVDNVMHRIRFTPEGNLFNSYGVLYAPLALGIGASLFGAADDTLVIKPFLAGQQMVTYHNVAITRMPTLRLSAGETILGEIEFTALTKNATLPSEADSLLTYAAHSAPDHSLVNFANITTDSWSAAWGLAPWNAFEALEGWSIEPEMEATPVAVDSAGVIDYTVSRLGCRARAIPLGPTSTDIFTALQHQGGNARRGRSLNLNAPDLVLTNSGGQFTITMHNAGLSQDSQAYGDRANRNGECLWVATREIGGVPAALTSLLTIEEN